MGDLMKNAFGSYDGMLRVTHPHYLVGLYCGIGAEVSRSSVARSGWEELDFRDATEGPTFVDAVLRFASVRATFSLCVALQHGHTYGSPAKLETLAILRTIGDRRAMPYVYGYALRVADALASDNDLRQALITTLERLSGKSVPASVAYDPAAFRTAVEQFAGEVP
jgi:hypothetical protein